MMGFMRIIDIKQASLESSSSLPLFLSTIPAGFPSPADDYVDKRLDLNELLIAQPAATFFVRVVGDSMQGAGISSGDLLVVDRSLQAASGSIIVAIVQGEFTVKRLRKEGDKIFLIAENPSYPSLEMNAESGFEVWGVVTYVIHPTN
jgi:DNA polymerase V